MSKVCGFDDCGVSTGIHEGLTFGRGKLDNLGYWEIPCEVCARNFDKNVEKYRESVYSECVDSGKMTIEETEQYLHEADWLNIQGWPWPENHSNVV